MARHFKNGRSVFDADDIEAAFGPPRPEIPEGVPVRMMLAGGNRWHDVAHKDRLKAFCGVSTANMSDTRLPDERRAQWKRCRRCEALTSQS